MYSWVSKWNGNNGKTAGIYVDDNHDIKSPT